MMKDVETCFEFEAVDFTVKAFHSSFDSLASSHLSLLDQFDSCVVSQQSSSLGRLVDLS